MALFSFRHSVRTFSPKCESADRAAKVGQTAAHLRYITRPGAARAVARERLDHPTDRDQANATEKAAQARQGRVCERFIIALPIEAGEEQRVALARAFAEALTQGKAGYVLAVHDKKGNDRANPHFHLVAFDKHEKTGGRGRPRSVLGMARKHAVEDTAKLWADTHNRLMREWGFGPSSAVSHLSFSKRDIDRIPEIHEGPTARQMTARGVAPKSKADWQSIDGGRSRARANIVIRQINSLKEQIEDGAADRLGSLDGGDAREGDGRRPPFGEDRGRGGPAPFGAARPESQPRRDDHAAGRDRPPPWLAGSLAKPPEPPFWGKPAKHLADPVGEVPTGAGGPHRRRRPVRRLFVELVMLRDTLRSRLAALRGRQDVAPLGSWVAQSTVHRRPPERASLEL